MSRTTRNSKTTKAETPVVTTGIAGETETPATTVAETTVTQPAKEKHIGRDLMRLMGFEPTDKVKLLRSYTINRYGKPEQKSMPEAFKGFMELHNMVEVPTSIIFSTMNRESIWTESVPSGSISFTSKFDQGKGLPITNIDWLLFFEKASADYSVSTVSKDRARIMDLLGE